MTIGERIKSLREQRDMSQTELASLIQSTKQNVYKYENGIILNIPTDKIEAIAYALHTTPAYLMGWEPQERKFTIDKRTYPTPIEMQEFPKNLQKRRNELKISFQKLSNLTGLNESVLQEYESGTRQHISFADLKVLAKALETSPEELLGWADISDWDNSMELMIDLLSYLGYEVETTDIPLDEQIAFLQSGYELIDDGESDITWIRCRKDNICYKIEPNQLLSIKQQTQDYIEFLVKKTLQQSSQIQQPKDYYELVNHFRD